MRSTRKKYRSKTLSAIHETMEALHEIGALDKQAMRDLDEACLLRAQAAKRLAALGGTTPTMANIPRRRKSE